MLLEVEEEEEGEEEEASERLAGEKDQSTT
jgi:hypothetical protein